ncbi:hypothetical protein SPRG_00636 [Saprolegnia parasitica CBS 223.65]|uniref:Uncharacterized protein n=1 Tax=Saprolegnia parasitica (strain CBS 223.65) TaxID=695850 RepID=A0A067CVN5_SAPPC|nr:hypothetical protein SPRG_00636 [Saprolegnia parasitica CBS 223.65]KDO34573.1 hypothetical protein SPRG_00636 [Saprolegnia parasitica CBS 223.65]|eukprot:XP_012194250.1 hypothetical protein SPRG_00636 [Saprolegnia parasitica CBS 223.65]
MLKQLVHVRDASTQLLLQLHAWHAGSPHPYLYKGESYTLRMKTDMDFLHCAKSLVQALGIAPQAMGQNPLMLAAAARKRVVPMTATPPPPFNPSESIDVPNACALWADHFLSWCWTFLDSDAQRPRTKQNSSRALISPQRPVTPHKPTSPRHHPLATVMMPFERFRPVDLTTERPGLLKPVLSAHTSTRALVSMTVDTVTATSDDISQLSDIKPPTQSMLFVLTMVYLLVTPGALTPKDVSWSILQQFYRHGNRVLRTLRKVDETSSSPDFELKCATLAPFLLQQPMASDPLFRPESLGRGADLLCAWMQRIMDGKDDDSRELLDQLDEVDVDVHHGTWVCHDLEYAVTLSLSGKTSGGVIVDIAAQVPEDNRLRVELTPLELSDIFGRDVAVLYERQAWSSMCALIVARLDTLASLPKELHAS